METVERDFAPLGVRFYYIYKALAHPEHNGYVSPVSLEERLLHIKEAQRTLGSRIPWICDSMENTLKHGLGNAPNSEFIIDPQGKVLQRRAWSDPNALRADLERLVGPTKFHTKIEDLDLKTSPPPDTVAKGLIPRLALPASNMQPMKVQPKGNNNNQPFFVKLRVESTPELLQTGKGQLYLGFFMDPLHHVHWNNLTEPLRFSLDLPPGIRTDTPTGNAPEVNHPADADPREFLIDLEMNHTPAPPPFLVTIDYFACDNDNTFCIPVRQVFEVTLERDQDGGRAMRRGARGPRGGSQRAPDMATRIRQRDLNGDGQISKAEWPPDRMEFFERLDQNGNGIIERNEMNRSPFGRPSPQSSPNQNRNFSNRTPPGFRILDQNQDGALSFGELEKLPQVLKDLDQNLDGQISRDEYRSITPR